MEVPESDEIVFTKEPPLATITLNRPARGNALTVSMHRAMRAIWEEIAAESAVRAVIVTGAGSKHFCTGIDVRNVAETGRTTTGSGPLHNELHWTARQNHVWKPTICVLNGMVGGAGLHFVADADIVIASEQVEFFDSHVNVGMVGGVENVGLLARLPIGAVQQMTLMGRDFRLRAPRAHALGLVDELVEADDLLSRAKAIGNVIAQNSPTAVARSMQAVWGAFEQSRAQAGEYAWTLVRAQWAHPDFREGPLAFAERRQPVWLDES